jgi:hypothetical protein
MNANEPVAWMQHHDETGKVTKYSPVQTWEDDIPLYTHPVKELTDEEINKTYLEKYDGHMGFLSPDEVREFARAILRKAQNK